MTFEGSTKKAIIKSYKNTGIVYLIQPAQIIGTNRFKIGMSYLNRLRNGYLPNGKNICIIQCNYPDKIEKLLIEE